MIDDTITNSKNFGYGLNIWETQDQVSGYSILELEDALYEKETWNGWRDKIISKYDNTTEANLTNLFLAYE